MSEPGQSRLPNALLLSVAMALLVALTGTTTQPAVSADSAQSEELMVAPLDMTRTRRPLVKVTGWVVEVGPAYVMIGERLLHTDPESSIASQTIVGTYAMATARLDDEGQLHAEHLFSLPPPDELTASAATRAPSEPSVLAQPPDEPIGYPLEFQGIIEQIDPRFWIVSGRMVFVTLRTEVDGRPEVGAMAQVKGMLLYQDTILAQSVRIVAPSAYGDVEFQGTIQSMAGDTWIVNGTTVKIGPQSVIDGTAAVGAIAQIRGLVQPDGSVFAQHLIIQYPGTAVLAEAEGPVESIAATQWVIGGASVLINSSTLVDDSRAPAEVGMWALASGYPEEDGLLLAIRIRLSRPE